MVVINYKKMSYQRLLVCFERSIKLNTKTGELSLECSDARDELIRKGRKSLNPILDYLRSTKCRISRKIEECNIEIMFVRLLYKIELNIDPKMTAPQDFRDIVGWINWAEKFA